jgi:hypothetical protein
MNDARPAWGRSLNDFGLLSLAEKKLLDSAYKGEELDLGDAGTSGDQSTYPELQTPDNGLRADFVRFLALGGDACNPVHDAGVRLIGGWVTGNLNLNDCILPNTLKFKKCVFDSKVNLSGATLNGYLYFSGSKLQKITTLNRLKVKDSVYLNQGFTAERVLYMIGIEIGGTLYLSGAQLLADGANSLSADRAMIGESVFIRDDEQWQFKANAAIRFESAVIKNSLHVKTANPIQTLNLQSARVHRLIDDLASWGNGLKLNGFQYDHIGQDACTKAPERIDWLKQQETVHLSLENFKPQPWRQLIKVLRDIGHEEDAREVAVAYQDHIRHIGLIGLLKRPPKLGPIAKMLFPIRAWIHSLIRNSLHVTFGVLMSYGYRPVKLVSIWMPLVWLVGAWIYWIAALNGDLGPSNPLVFLDERLRQQCTSNGQIWFTCQELPIEYATFSPLAYSLDVLLPLVDLQQENAWGALIPTPRSDWTELFQFWTHPWAYLTRLYMWFEILFGWISSLLLVAVLSGLTEQKNE